MAWRDMPQLRMKASSARFFEHNLVGVNGQVVNRTQGWAEFLVPHCFAHLAHVAPESQVSINSSNTNNNHTNTRNNCSDSDNSNRKPRSTLRWPSTPNCAAFSPGQLPEPPCVSEVVAGRV